MEIKIDKSNFRDIILNSDKQLKANLEFFNKPQLKKLCFNKVLLCGMGGSALMGDIFYYFKVRNYIPLKLGVPIFTHRSYNLPPDTDQNTLVICVSYSGNTEETISLYKKAEKNNLEIAAVTCGGKLADLCQKNQTPWVKITDNKIPPRCSLGYQLRALIQIFVVYNLLPSADQDNILAISEKIKPAKLEKNAKLLAKKLINKIPIIYSSEENKALARIWKIKFNENTKIPAFWNSFPELNHNEMVGWNKAQSHFHFLFLTDNDDLPKIQKRMSLTAKILKSLKMPIDFVKLQGFTPLEKLFWSLILSDWLSYYSALAYNIDPMPVEIVEKFKKELT